MPKRIALELDDRLALLLVEVATDAVQRAVADAEAWAEDEAAYAEYERTGESIPLEAAEA